MLEGHADAPLDPPKNKGGRPPGADTLEKRRKAREDADKFDAWCKRWRLLKPPSRVRFDLAPVTLTPGAREALHSGW